MLLIWIIVGGIAGILASMLTGDDKDYGCAASIIIGMIGSLIGGALESLLRTGQLSFSLAFTDFTFTSIAVSTLGAIVFLGIIRLFK